MIMSQTAEYGSFRQDLGCGEWEKAQILGSGARNSCQARIMGELKGKSNKICVQ